MSAAIGRLEQATTVIRLPAGVTPQGTPPRWSRCPGYNPHHLHPAPSASFPCRDLPSRWYIDARAAAKQKSTKLNTASPTSRCFGLSGFGPSARARLSAGNTHPPAIKASRAFRKVHPEYRIVNVVRGRRSTGGRPLGSSLQKVNIVALGGRIEALTDKMGLLGPEVADEKALNIPLDQAEILVTNKEVIGQRARSSSATADRRPAPTRQYEARMASVPSGSRPSWSG